MLHLPADRLAELADTEPTPEECTHLEACSACAAEQRAYATLRAMASAERERPTAPLLTWERLREGLADERLVAVPQPAPREARARLATINRWSLRAAASFLLVAGGVALGRWSERDPEPADSFADAAAASSPTGGVIQASAGSASFSSRAEAMSALIRAQQDYQRAAAYLVATDTTIAPGTPSQYRERLAALDEVMGVTRDALARAPHDPVMNSYYLTTLGAREATLQQLQLALPAGTRIDRF